MNQQSFRDALSPADNEGIDSSFKGGVQMSRETNIEVHNQSRKPWCSPEVNKVDVSNLSG